MLSFKYSNAELVDPIELKDHDSKFTVFQGLRMHYKVKKPFAELTDDDFEVLGEDGTLMLNSPAVLLHGFGASLFSWRKVLSPLAHLLGSNAVAFDRPAFGLTSRIKPKKEDILQNEYSVSFSAKATLDFADKLLSVDKPKQQPALLIR